MSGANRLGRRSAGHVCRRAAAGQRTCWRIEEEQDRIENAAWADWTQCQEVRADDILLQQTNVAAASGLSATADPTGVCRGCRRVAIPPTFVTFPRLCVALGVGRPGVGGARPPAPPYGAQCRQQGPVPDSMTAWYKFLQIELTRP